ncbi:putative ATP-dependent RNA helicase spindle-E [Diplonema papillatum]|nr:putative ATP-dependent RNA helicase spindle-E [Diplonema papillatum]
MATLDYDTGSDSAWSEPEQREDETIDEDDDEMEELPYKTVVECTIQKQRLTEERDGLKHKVEVAAGNYTLSQIEDMKCRIEDIDDEVTRIGAWQVGLQKEKFGALRTRLSVWKHREELLRLVDSNRVSIVTGATGCGKSTQVPQILLDSMTSSRFKKPVLVAQTRRIATTSVAARVALERGEVLGKTVGFTIGGCTANSRHTRLHFVTTGVLLAMLTGGDALRRYSYLVIDEVHERLLDIDLVLTIVRSLMLKRNNRLRLVLMSATMEGFKRKMQEYFHEVNCMPADPFAAKRRRKEEAAAAAAAAGGGGEGVQKAPERGILPTLAEMAGTATHTAGQQQEDGTTEPKSPPPNDNTNSSGEVPVVSCGSLVNYQIKYLSDISVDGVGVQELRTVLRRPRKARLTAERLLFGTKLVAELHVVLPAASNVLVFLPGISEITEMYCALERVLDPGTVQVLCLHSSVSVEEQNRVFRDTHGKRMVVLSTNIAESALTIRNLGVVLDYCLYKDNVYDPLLRTSSLTLQWCSKAMCTQRAGRCGRSFAGTVYRMVGFEEYRDLPDATAPEISTSPIQTTCLKVLNMRWIQKGVYSFLSDLLDPPESEAIVTQALVDLEDMQLCYPTPSGHAITYIGKLAALFCLDVNTAVLILHGHMYGCLNDAFVIAAARRTGKSVIMKPFRQPLLGSMLELSYAGPCLSDDIAIVNAYSFWIKRRPSAGSEVHSEQVWCISKGLSLPALREVHDVVLKLRVCASKIGLCDPPMAAEQARRLEQKLRSVELLAASDIDEAADISLGLDASETAKDLAKILLVHLTLNAAHEDDKKELKARQRIQLESAYSVNDAVLMKWVLHDAIRETEPFHLPPESQLNITACLAASHLHHTFCIGHAKHEGVEPRSRVEGADIGNVFLNLELSRAFKKKSGTPAPEVPALKAVEGQLRIIRNLAEAGAKKVANEPTLPVRALVLRPEAKQVEVYLRGSAVGVESSTGWYCQSACNKVYMLRVAYRLLDRRLQIPSDFEPDESTTKAKRTRDGKLKLPGRRAHEYTARNVAVIAKVKAHSSVSAVGVLTYSAGRKQAVVVPRQTCIACPFVLLRPNVVGFGIATTVSGRKHRLFLESGTVINGCPGTPELLTLLVDPSLTLLAVEECVGDAARREVLYETSRGDVKKKVALRMPLDLLRHVANYRQVGAHKVAALFEGYRRHVKRCHDENRLKNAALPEFDEARIVRNSWKNPFSDYADLETAEVPEVQEGPADEPGIISHKPGFAVINKLSDEEHLNEITHSAAAAVTIACEPDSRLIMLPDLTLTLTSK